MDERLSCTTGGISLRRDQVIEVMLGLEEEQRPQIQILKKGMTEIEKIFLYPKRITKKKIGRIFLRIDT